MFVLALTFDRNDAAELAAALELPQAELQRMRLPGELKNRTVPAS